MYKPGDWHVICDRCGRQRYASECSLTWENLFVCSDTCWETRHPQDFVEAKIDDQTVPISRPDIVQSIGETTVKTTAARYATSIDIDSIAGLSQYDSIGIGLDNGIIHWDVLTATPAGNTITIYSGLPAQTTSGNTVYKPSVNKETYVTATSILASEL